MCFDNKINSLNYTIRNIGRLPNIGEFSFEDGTDQRTFYDDNNKIASEYDELYKKKGMDLIEDIFQPNKKQTIKKLNIKRGIDLVKETLSEYLVSSEESEERVITFKQKLEDIKNKEIIKKENDEFIKSFLLEENIAKEEAKINDEEENNNRINKLGKLQQKALIRVKAYLNIYGEILKKEELMLELCQIIYPNSNATLEQVQKVMKV